MAYYSGTASSLADLRTALLTHAQTDGWVLTGDVLSKAGVFFRIQVTATNITCLGCESNAVVNPAPAVVMVGRIFERTGYTTREISFPCNYEVMGFAQELYLVINYDVSTYQWMAFGKSTVPGLPGQGGWCGATVGSGFQGSVSGNNNVDPISIQPNAGGGGNPGTSGALFWHTVMNDSNINLRNCWVNHNLDAHGWTWNGTTSNVPIGIRHLDPLVANSPSVWNSEATLLPLRCYKERPSFKSTLIADLQHARILRINNLAPGDILTIGSDKWKVFPWYIKNSAAPTGNSSMNIGINHTGTMGWAIRYEGP